MAVFLLYGGIFGTAVNAQVSEAVLECMCKQKNRNRSLNERLLGMCVGHYEGSAYQQRCGSSAACLANSMNNGVGYVDVSKCIR